MRIADVVGYVKAHRGKILVPMLVSDEVVHVQAVKSDLLCVLSTLQDDQVSFEVEDGVGYIRRSLG